MKGLLDKFRKNSIEPSYFDFYHLFLKYRTEPNNISLDDVLALKEIASRCPGTSGPAVFQAQALHQIITGQIYPFSSDCGNSSGARTIEQNSEEKVELIKSVSESVNLIIYPNPSKTSITILSDDAFKFTAIQIIDLTQRLCYSQDFGELRNQADLDFNLSNGMYLMKIQGMEKQITIKFCVEK